MPNDQHQGGLQGGAARSDELVRVVTIVNQRGLHARAAAKFVKLADQFAAEITVIKGDTAVSGRSIMGLMMLAAAPGTEIELRARGADAAAAIAALGREETPPEGGERVFEGLGVAPGIAIGVAHLVESGIAQVREYHIATGEVAAEQARFAEAVAKAQKQIRKLKAKSQNLPPAVAEEVDFLLEAHLQMLTGSRVVRGVERRIAEDRLNAEAAVQAEIAEVAQKFAALDDPYLAARADDIREVGNRLIRNLTKTPYQAFSHLPEGSILVAEELTPADTALMDPHRVAGFATLLGGAESHTAIMARSLALPAVLGVAGLIGAVRTGDAIVVDGAAGRVIVNPTETRLAELRHRQAEIVREQRQLARLRRLPALTRDGTHIAL